MTHTSRVFCGLATFALLGCGTKPAPVANQAAPKQKVGMHAFAGMVPGGLFASTSTSTTPAVETAKIVPVADIYKLPADDGQSLSVDDIKKYLDDPAHHETIVPQAPPGFKSVENFIPKDNPITMAKAELGRMLYFDTRLSNDKTISCASCHDPGKGWAENTSVSTGFKGRKGGRNAPTVMNRVFGKTQFWDGRSPSLEDQALGPIQNPIEMGMATEEQLSLEDVVKRLNESAGYKLMFEKVFGAITPENIGKAIATFERTVIVGGSPFDYFLQAEPFLKMSKDDFDDLENAAKERAKKILAAYEKNKLSDAALRGRALYFGKAECSLCHVGENLSDELFYNIGVGMKAIKPDEGRKAVTKNDADTGAFKTPSLRNVALTAPYMHDGSEKTLMDTINVYDRGGTPNKWQSNRIKKLNLTQEEKNDLLKFLEEGLTGALPDIKKPRLP